METIIVFFRDTLSGILYIVVSIVCSILILICIWQLIRRSKNKKIAEEKFSSSHIVIVNDKGEKETIEMAPSTVVSQENLIFSNVMSPSSTNARNVPVTSAVADIASNDPQFKKANNKSVIMINPLEVAAVSSTMNIIGATSVQKAYLDGKKLSDSANNQSNAVSGVVNTQVASTVTQSDSSNIPQSSNVITSSSTPNNQNFTN